jgi:hypothetical protein
VQCPQCDHTCKFSVDTDKEAKHCYDSECEPICIPKVVFPWQKKKACCNSCNSCAGGCDACAGTGCDGSCGGGSKCCNYNNGACIRYVNKLKKYEYECEVCKYKWEAIRGCGNGCGSCAGSIAPGIPSVPGEEVAPTAADSELPPAPPALDAAKAPSRGILRYISF